MKIWYHVIAAVVGLAVAALIVYAVFGSASEQGATQDGTAPTALSDGGSLCGTITAAEGLRQSAITKAAKNSPALFLLDKPIDSINSDRPDQQRWVARVHAGAGLCVDELRFGEANAVTLNMSTVDSVSKSDVDAFVMQAIGQAFTAPINPPTVTVELTIGSDVRTIEVSQRAWRLFTARAKQVKQPLTTHNLVLFRKAVKPSGLAIRGWS